MEPELAIVDVFSERALGLGTRDQRPHRRTDLTARFFCAGTDASLTTSLRYILTARCRS